MRTAEHSFASVLAWLVAALLALCPTHAAQHALATSVGGESGQYQHGPLDHHHGHGHYGHDAHEPVEQDPSGEDAPADHSAPLCCGKVVQVVQPRIVPLASTDFDLAPAEISSAMLSTLLFANHGPPGRFDRSSANPLPAYPAALRAIVLLT